MDMEVSDNAKVTLAQIAADWGTSVAYVSRMKNQKGCPVDSLAAARDWRLSNSRGGVGFRSKRPEQSGEQGEAPARVRLPRRRSLREMENSLRASIEIEEQAKYLVESAIAADAVEKLPLLIQTYNKAKEGRMASERMVLEIREKARVLIPFDEAREMFGKGWGALLARLRGLPAILAPKVNPQDDVTAAEIIRQDIERAIADGQKVYEQVLA
jgi:hypothetical protein